MSMGLTQMTDRELLLLVLQKVEDIGKRMDRIDERLSTGDRRFAEHDTKFIQLDTKIEAAYSNLSRALAPLNTMPGRVEMLEEAVVIDGDDGKPLTVREVVIREQRARLAGEAAQRRLALIIGALSPIVTLIIERLLARL